MHILICMTVRHLFKRSRTDYDAEQSWSFWNLQIHPGAWRGHCQSVAGVLKPFVTSDSCEPCCYCQRIAGVLKSSVHLDSFEPCCYCQSIAGVLKSSVDLDSCKPCGLCQSTTWVLRPSVHSDSCKQTLQPLPKHCRDPQTFCPLR